tara:strand:- start:3265 stop:6288 length:3024 start_codon:yes stop_codon:yes gene_type:complete
MVQIDFGPAEKEFKRYEVLEIIDEELDIFDTLAEGTFGTPRDFRRILTFEKIKGDLTNIFYSMESSNTDFYAHQFKPVMRFIESPVGRMLIADEVGLGKTIEAAYIWKEVQARESGRRLLIVCPAMLREKWKSDLFKRFNISAEIVSAKDLLEKLKNLPHRQSNDSFVYIASLEALRPPAKFEEESITNAHAQIARILDSNTASEEFALFDQVIIDEAHYLRNPSTANNRLARLLRDASRHLVLLTATPIQIGSENLYQLLRLIDPDQFYDEKLFKDILNTNSCIVRAQRALWARPVNVENALQSLSEAEETDYFRNDAVLMRIRKTLSSATCSAEDTVEILRMLESRSLLSQYMTRSRKREVLEKRVERGSQVLSVTFSPAESKIYHYVTEKIRSQSKGQSGFSLFPLIARQRQMTSSIIGALESWKEKDLLDDLLWEDFGISTSLINETNDIDTPSTNNNAQVSTDNVAFGADYDIATLEKEDTKYKELITFLQKELKRNPNEKFVIFSFYRGTLKYLARRLKADGIPTALIMGGQEKESVIQNFSESDGPSILLSSEVGSEGIDLQFCRFVVNYDLPWNPMRVEQRIGRIDRLGQTAERISIINLYVENTIEDRVLMRLYDRIDVFRESIGDLEEILGDITEKLMIELLNPELTDEERTQRAEHTALAIQNKRQQQNELEQEAVNLIGFSDYILENIKDSRKRGHWLSGEELHSLVNDFFASHFIGTVLDTDTTIENSALITLSSEAKTSLGYYIDQHKPAALTKLHQSSRPILCVFSPRRSGMAGTNKEFIDSNHPLLLWIRSHYENNQSELHRVVAMDVNSEMIDGNIKRGDYVFSVHRWSFSGLKSNQLLAFRAIRLGDNTPLDAIESENLISSAAPHANHIPNAKNVLTDMKKIQATALLCEEALENSFYQRLADFEAENTVRCNQQEMSARKFAKRRIDELETRIQKFRAENKTKPIPMTEGQIRKQETELDLKLNRISKKKEVDPTLIPLAIGVLRVH